MAKPTNTYDWSTGPGTTEEPPSDMKVAGFSQGQRPPPKWHNWLWNGASKWHAYLSNLHNEPDFLSKNYSWAGQTRVASEVLYCNAITGDAEMRERTVYIPLSAFVPGYDISNNRASWRFYHLDNGTQIYWDMVSENKALIALMPLPHQSVITSVRAGVSANGVLGSGGTLEMTVGLAGDMEGFTGSEHLTSMNWGTPVTVNGYNGVMTAYPPTHEIDGARHSLAVRFVGLDGGQCRTYWGKTVFADPGPRNF